MSVRSSEGERSNPTKKKRRVRGNDWAELPEELLTQIAKRVTCVEDMSSFSAVCTSWRAVTAIVKPKWSPSMPLLMLHHTIVEDSSSKWTLFDTSTNKRCELDIPRGIGSFPSCVDGWVFSIDSSRVTIFNPFTEARISLPCTYTLPGKKIPRHTNKHGMFELAVIRYRWFQSTILVKVPSKNELFLFAIHEMCWLVFAKHGDSVWSSVDCVHEPLGSRISVEGIIHFDGKILVLYKDGTLVGLDVDLLVANTKYVVDKEYVCGATGGSKSILRNINLVESFGDILLVMRNSTYYEAYDIMKLDSKKKVWVSVDDIGDVSLFLGFNYAIAVRAANEVCCMANHVYFIKHDVILDFNYHTGIFEEIYGPSNKVLSKNTRPFWCMPNFTIG